MKPKTFPDSLSEKMTALKQEGYLTDFRFNKGKLSSYDGHRSYTPDQIKLIDTFRFEGESNPADSAILYAIECKPTGEKGLVATSYGAQADEDADEFFKAV